jgi:tungstate transport system ATP-binding protein
MNPADHDTAPLYSLRNVTQQYTGNDGARHTALDIAGLDIAQGEILGVAGANGSGKSTLMRLLAFLEPPASGSLFFDGSDACAAGTAVRRQVTLLTQEPYLLHRSVAANIAYGLRARGKDASHSRLAEALQRVRLDPDDFLRRPWFRLSGGEAQRVALAARLVLRPRVLLLDEPTASLDEDSSAAVRHAVLTERRERGTTLVIVSHDHGWLRDVTDRIIRISKGRME